MALIYLILFLLSLIVGVLVCNGIWIATNGRTEDMVDGSKYDTENMVLYWLYKLIANPRKKYFEYNENNLSKLLLQLMKSNDYFYNAKVEKDRVLFNEGYSAKLAYSKILFEKYIDLDSHVVILNDEENSIQFRKYYWGVNHFSKPIVACIKCFSSFWGSITFWTIVYIFKHENLLNRIDYNVILPMWLFVVVCMSPLNVLLEKRTRE